MTTMMANVKYKLLILLMAKSSIIPHVQLLFEQQKYFLRKRFGNWSNLICHKYFVKCGWLGNCVKLKKSMPILVNDESIC